MAHPPLQSTGVGLGDHPGAERMAVIVEAQPAQPDPM